MNDFLKNTCKVGQGDACCRYIVAGRTGINCAKFTPLKDTIDKRVEAGLFVAISDNCAGLHESIDLAKYNPQNNEQIQKEASSN